MKHLELINKIVLTDEFKSNSVPCDRTLAVSWCGESGWEKRKPRRCSPAKELSECSLSPMVFVRLFKDLSQMPTRHTCNSGVAQIEDCPFASKQLRYLIQCQQYQDVPTPKRSPIQSLSWLPVAERTISKGN